MRKYFLWISCVLLICSISVIGWKPVSAGRSTTNFMTAATKGLFEQYAETVYQTAKLQEAGLSMEVFQ